MGKMAIIAIGGNAILLPHESGSKEEQLKNIRLTCDHIARMIEHGHDVVITHGNGPQVGNILLRNEMAEGKVPSMPMDVCVAESQGQMGYMIQQSLKNALRQLGIEAAVTSLVTQVVVDVEDDAFENPTKPVGPYYQEEEAEALARKKGWTMMEDAARKGYRRVVPSPEPLDIVELDIIKQILANSNGGNIIIAAGGGGVPVTRTPEGFEGAEAVVDKDLASQVLASGLNAQLLIMLTDVEKVAINYKKSNQEDLARLTVPQAREHLREGQFPPGSMGPKIVASIRFLEGGGERVIITRPRDLMASLNGEAGTSIVSD